MSYYVHSVPGRLRVKSPVVKEDPGSAEDIQRLLQKVAGVDSTAVRPLTGSVIINYDTRAVDSGTILDVLKHRGYLDASKIEGREDYLEAAAAKAGGVIGKALLSFFLGKALEGSPLWLLTVLL